MTDHTITAPALTPRQKAYGVFKRGMDILCSILGLVVLAVPFAVLALVIHLDDRGPVFFRQERVGRYQKPFTMLKFRTMRTDTPHNVPSHMLENPDQYMTRTGRFLRYTSMDELPQLINILRGEMSLIGHRPALPNEHTINELRASYGVHQLRPGLTGWAQIHGRDKVDFRTKAAMDREYLIHFGLKMDIRCFIGTFPVVLCQPDLPESGTGRTTIPSASEDKIKIGRMT